VSRAVGYVGSEWWFTDGREVPGKGCGSLVNQSQCLWMFRGIDSTKTNCSIQFFTNWKAVNIETILKITVFIVVNCFGHNMVYALFCVGC